MGAEERSMPATKGDIIRIHEQLDAMRESIMALSTTLAVLQARPVYKQPCEFFLAHRVWHEHREVEIKQVAKEKKQDANDWRKAGINGITTVIVSLIVAYLVVRFGIK